MKMHRRDSLKSKPLQCSWEMKIAFYLLIQSAPPWIAFFMHSIWLAVAWRFYGATLTLWMFVTLTVWLVPFKSCSLKNWMERKKTINNTRFISFPLLHLFILIHIIIDNVGGRAVIKYFTHSSLHTCSTSWIMVPLLISLIEVNFTWRIATAPKPVEI